MRGNIVIKASGPLRPYGSELPRPSRSFKIQTKGIIDEIDSSKTGYLVDIIHLLYRGYTDSPEPGGHTGAYGIRLLAGGCRTNSASSRVQAAWPVARCA